MAGWLIDVARKTIIKRSSIVIYTLFIILGCEGMLPSTFSFDTTDDQSNGIEVLSTVESGSAFDADAGEYIEFPVRLNLPSGNLYVVTIQCGGFSNKSVYTFAGTSSSVGVSGDEDYVIVAGRPEDSAGNPVTGTGSFWYIYAINMIEYTIDATVVFRASYTWY